MTLRAGAKVDAVDWDLPDIVSVTGAGTNVITATTTTDLPTTSCIASITNPHPTANLICLVTFGAWFTVGGGIRTRICPRVSGSTTIAAGIAGGGPVGWGEVPMSTISTQLHVAASATYSLPASATAATFTMQAYRDSASGTQNVDYPTIRIIPLRFDI
jgi:hypothetical protein